MIKNTETLAKFLKEDARLVVPTFQRPYAWRGDEVNELFDDIIECQGQTGKGLYLGSFILDTSKFDESKTIEIVDGQQRLTTLFLLLIACREHAKEIKSHDQVQTSQKFISFIDDVKGATTEMRLQVAPSIKSVFEYMANSTWDGISFPENLGKLAIRKVKPTYEFFRKQLKEYDDVALAQFRESVPKEIFYPDESVARKGHDIEHICSTAYNKKFSNTDQVQFIDNIGNLTVMSHYLNKSLGDKSPEDKGKLLRGKLASRAASYPEVEKLATEYLTEDVCWNDKAILMRASDLAKLSYTTVWNF